VRLLQQKLVVLASVSVIGFVIAGSSTGVIGSILGPLMQEFRWSNSLTSSLASAYSLGVLLTTPAVGFALDKLGACTVMTFGAAVTSIAFILASHCHSWSAMMAAFGMAGVGVSASFYLPSAVVVTNWMSTQRSLGMGIVLSAMSAGTALFSPLIGLWTEMLGWRTTVEGVAALIALTLPLTVLVIRTKPANALRTANSVAGDVIVVSPKGYMLSPIFILATAGGVLFSVGMQGIYFHVVPLLVKAGYSPHLAGVAFGAAWLLSGLGSLVLGFVADKFDAKRVLAGSLLCCALGTLCLLGVSEMHVGVVCVGTFVLFWGTSTNSFGQLAPVILAERFGSKNLGTLIGIQFAIAGIAGAVAPIFTGLLYDKVGDYHLAIDFSALAIFTGFVLILTINIPEVVCGKNTRTDESEQIMKTR